MVIYYKWICNHCNVDVTIQPPKESGCNHVHYPEACEKCSKESEYKEIVIRHDLSKITKGYVICRGD